MANTESHGVPLEYGPRLPALEEAMTAQSLTFAVGAKPVTLATDARGWVVDNRWRPPVYVVSSGEIEKLKLALQNSLLTPGQVHSLGRSLDRDTARREMIGIGYPTDAGESASVSFFFLPPKAFDEFIAEATGHDQPLVDLVEVQRLQPTAFAAEGGRRAAASISF